MLIAIHEWSGLKHFIVRNFHFISRRNLRSCLKNLLQQLFSENSCYDKFWAISESKWIVELYSPVNLITIIGMISRTHKFILKASPFKCFNCDCKIKWYKLYRWSSQWHEKSWFWMKNLGVTASLINRG